MDKFRDAAALMMPLSKAQITAILSQLGILPKGIRVVGIKIASIQGRGQMIYTLKSRPSTDEPTRNFACFILLSRFNHQNSVLEALSSRAPS